ncbi:MAG: M18 family aminopeptidase [Bacteroidales bacterium]|nr:M18 family aminopeptidase [Clostridium sp.]MCM1203189.1 M18 family aminopeptidase [Bacteroidales bacterium]
MAKGYGKEGENVEQLSELLREGVTAAHTVNYIRQDLLNNRFTELDIDEEWHLEENGKYYVNLYGTNMLAFAVGKGITAKPAFRIAMAHSDYPCFQIKPNPIMKGKHNTRLNVEVYGGMAQKSWLDRPLGIAGTVVVKGEAAFMPKTLLYKSGRPLCIIPSLAVHMDRELNKKGVQDTAKELVPLAALTEDGDLMKEIAGTLGIEPEGILDFDLFLYNMEKPVRVGLDSAMLSSPRLDNLTSAGAILAGLKQCSVPQNTIAVMAVFDHEEVGSRSRQGADSGLFSMVLEKAGKALTGEAFTLCSVLKESFLLSVDVAHGHHPNYEEKSDGTSKAYMGKGLCIKRSVGQKYGTNAESSSVVKRLCQINDIPFTVAVNKTGIPGGSTLGPIVTAHLPVPCADIGMPVLAMHSAVELGAVEDYLALKRLLLSFFE